MAWHSGKPVLADTVASATKYIRENFAELEPLHSHVTELIDLTALYPHIAELIDLMALQPYVAELIDLPALQPYIAELVDLTALQPHVAELVDLTALQPYVAELVDFIELQPHIAELLDSRIVEMGSNSNGTYVRWENGLQVCYHRLNIGAPSGSVVQSFSWTYPAAFASSNNAYPIGMMAVSDSSDLTRYSNMAVRRSSETLATQTTFYVEFYDPPSVSAHIHAFAIGRWK